MENTRRKFLGWLLAAPLAGLIAKPGAATVEEKKVLINKFSVAGFQYYKGPRLIKKIKPGDALKLSAEPANAHDEFAVEIFYNSHKIGYVPMSDNRHVSRLLQENMKLHCAVAEVHPTMQTWEMLRVEVFLVS